MKEYLEILDKNLITKSMKVLFWITPIILVTNNMFIHIRGDYYFQWLLINNETIKNAIYSILIFGSIVLLSHYFEEYILPFSMMLIKNKSKSNNSKIGSYLNKIYGVNIIDKLKQQDISMLDIFRTLAEIPTTIIMWLLFTNSIYGFIFIPIVFYLFYIQCISVHSEIKD